MMIDRSDHLTVLDVESIDAERMRCSECGDTAPGDKLLIFSTVRGARSRVHDGAFCSKFCHDAFHGLMPKPQTKGF